MIERPVEKEMNSKSLPMGMPGFISDWEEAPSLR